MPFKVITMSFNDNLVNGKESDVFAKLIIGGKEDVDGAEGVGPFDAIFNVMDKILSRHYEIKGKIRFADCKVHFIDIEEKGAAATSVVRVTFECSGEQMEFIGESDDINKAGFLAIAEGFKACLRVLIKKSSQAVQAA